MPPGRGCKPRSGASYLSSRSWETPSLYVKEPKVRIQPHQWVEVARLTGLGPDEFRDTVYLAKLGKYLGEANLHDAGLAVLEVLAKTNAQA
jgi:hypothetical protein